MINLQEHVNAVNKVCGYCRFATALYGSQNYNLHNDNSDVDTKSILIPNYKQVIFEEHRKTGTISLPNDEQANYYDVRSMFQQFRKQNINFLEILYTDYVDVDGMFDWAWQELIAHRDQIARMNQLQSWNAMLGAAKSRLIRAQNTGVGKDLASGLFFANFAVDFHLELKDFATCLKPTGEVRNALMAAKYDKAAPEEVRAVAREAEVNVNNLNNAWCKEMNPEENQGIAQFLHNLCYDIIRVHHLTDGEIDKGL